MLSLQQLTELYPEERGGLSRGNGRRVPRKRAGGSEEMGVRVGVADETYALAWACSEERGVPPWLCFEVNAAFPRIAVGRTP